MSESKQSSAAMLDYQLASRAAVNEAVEVEELGDGLLRLRVPLVPTPLSRWLGLILPVSKEKVVELDSLGCEVFRLCDGETTVEMMIDLFSERYQLTFFEARGMIFEFLRTLLRNSFIVMIADSDTDVS